MMPLYRAELKKISGNRLLVGCTIWIWPFLACCAASILTLVFTLNGEARDSYERSPFEWTDVGLAPWVILNSALGRFLLVIFVCVIFAGEYEHRTWKTVMPGNERLRFIIIKYLAFGSFIVMGFGLMMLLVVLCFGLMHLIVGVGYPPALSGEVILDFLGNLALNAGLAFTSTLIIASIAILISIYTQSILFGIMAGLFVVALESIGIPLLLAIAAGLLHIDLLFDLIFFTPSFHIENISSWINLDRGVRYFEDNSTIVSLPVSILALAVWLFGLIGLSIFFFRRQDIQ
jgi:hypothetical protein